MLVGCKEKAAALGINHLKRPSPCGPEINPRPEAAGLLGLGLWLRYIHAYIYIYIYIYIYSLTISNIILYYIILYKRIE